MISWLSDVAKNTETLNSKDIKSGKEMYNFAAKLFPICRSLTGKGVRETLQAIKSELPLLEIKSVKSGTSAFDWTVPEEWEITGAVLIGPDGQEIINFENNNLHVVGYSEPVDIELSLEDLQPHLHSLIDQPDVIPYVTSYYKKRWGFCLSQKQRDGLVDGTYRAKINARHFDGVMNYAELFIPGETTEEVFFSTYICHPSMANNELSGPTLSTWLAKFVATKKRRYSYRFIFIPETIGSIYYISQNIERMKNSIVAGFNLSCVGDNHCYSFMPSRTGDTLSDRVAKHVLDHRIQDYISYSFLERGSDERQYCSPGVDLPIASILRSKYGEYKEYHTSKDDMDFISPNGLAGTYRLMKDCIEILENNIFWQHTTLCEPQLGKRGLYPTLSVRSGAEGVKKIMNVLAYADGKNDLIQIASLTGLFAIDVINIIKELHDKGLLISR